MAPLQMTTDSPKDQSTGTGTDPTLAEELTNRLNAAATNDHADLGQEDLKEQTISRRRQSSIVSRPGLSFNNLPSSIPPPVPESLPTTPGYELSQNMFEQTLVPPSDLAPPSQQRPGLKKQATATTITKLLDYDEQIPAGLEDNVMSISNPPMNRYRVIAGCAFVFTCGMSDGALGALLPHIEAYYNISYAIVSLLWLGNAIGFITIAFTAHWIDSFLGLQKVLTVSVALYTVMFALISSGTLFPVLIIGFFFGGLGGAMAISQYNIFLSKLLNGSKYLGIFHGCYGLGAFIAPLLGTAMVNAGAKWNYFYFIPLGFSIICFVGTALAFSGCHVDLAKWEDVEITDVQAAPSAVASPSEEIDLQDITAGHDSATVGQSSTTQTGAEPAEKEQKHDFAAALKDYRSWLTCFFIFFYQGSEVAIGGWMVTYLLDYRGGNEKSVGYVSSGFWAGVTLGRFLLTHAFTKWFGVRRTLIVLHLLIIVLDILAWLIPNVIVEAVCACFIGVCIGPMYPMMVGLLTRVLPRKIRFCAMTLGTAFGSSGGSAIPFAVGMASQFAGTYVLHPIFLVCYGFMFITWLLFPNIERKGGQSTIWQRLW
ncbi:Bypass of stop codon protein 6 [Cyberlindnera fabianii]|uniref:Bypass of stop codon protein 6 n=1 Tax=Cyberlindnera fabianii TaxID=36022 RepID=A0A1V2L5T8_CYBFA|nr:Bypass of stop codon protein 6 [Cyberlindnera fabianii]